MSASKNIKKLPTDWDGSLMNVPIHYFPEECPELILEWIIKDAPDREWIRLREEQAFETCGDDCYNFTYLKKGLLEEVGECCGLVKRVWRGDYTENELFQYEKFRLHFLKELGDVQWYACVLNRWFHLRGGKPQTFPLVYYRNKERYETKFRMTNDIDAATDYLMLRAVTFINDTRVIPILSTIHEIARLLDSSGVEVGTLNYKKLQNRVKQNSICGNGGDR